MRLVLFAGFFLPIAASAQAAVTLRLEAPAARLAEEFSDLVAMRELADGRVLLSDRRERRLVVGDLSSGVVRDIARTGRGPGEVEDFVFRLLPMGGDSTLAADMNRWLVVRGDSVVATLPPDLPAKRSVSLWPIAAGTGRLLSEVFLGGFDSTHASLVDFRTGKVDTIATLRRGNSQRSSVRETRTPEGGQAVAITRVPMDVRDAPMLFPDGWVAVARLRPYRVEWRSPDGRWIRGAPLPFTEVRVTEGERAAYVARRTGFRNATEWPEVLPPFDTPTELFATPEGMLAIRRIPTAARPETRYDIVDRQGRLRVEVVMAPNHRILGFGARSVYVVETDDDGIQRLQRHGWESARFRD